MDVSQLQLYRPSKTIQDKIGFTADAPINIKSEHYLICTPQTNLSDTFNGLYGSMAAFYRKIHQSLSQKTQIRNLVLLNHLRRC